MNQYLAEALNFFLYDIVKIGFLLILINFFMAAVRYYLPTEKIRDILITRRWFGLDYLLAAILGVVTPFCSCSSIPLFIGFIGAGIPVGVTFAFLISSPLVNESSLYLFPAIFGFKVTLLYNLAGIAIAVIGGLIIQKLNVQKFIKPELLKISAQPIRSSGKSAPGFSFLVKHFWLDGFQITKTVFPFVVIGVAIGALIHGFVPVSLIERYLSSRSWWSVPLAVFFGAPLYANSVGVLPIMQALVGKGVPLGTALAFMTSVVTLSFPEFLILSKVMRWQLLAIFFGITTLGIITLGYLFN